MGLKGHFPKTYCSQVISFSSRSTVVPKFCNPSVRLTCLQAYAGHAGVDGGRKWCPPSTPIGLSRPCKPSASRRWIAESLRTVLKTVQSALPAVKPAPVDCRTMEPRPGTGQKVNHELENQIIISTFVRRTKSSDFYN